MVDGLINYLNKGRSAFQATDLIKEELKKNGFKELFENEEYHVSKGDKCFVVRNGSSILAFDIGENLNDPSFHICASHSDCPALIIKPNAILNNGAGVSLDVEVYGGPIINSWFDRPLSLAGRVMVNCDDGIKEENFMLEEPFCIIPSVAPHILPSGDHKTYLNVDIMPYVSDEKEFSLEKFLTNKLNKEVLSYDLFLYPIEEALVWNNFISSHHLDNLECAYTSLMAFINSHNENNINAYICFDNEEIGSETRQGADSPFLDDNIRRISSCLGIDYSILISKGFMLSCDNAHALHPNHPELYDKINAPKLNEGIVIKTSGIRKYTSDALGIALVKKLFDNANVKYQMFANRTDSRGGGTLGHVSVCQTPLLTVDIGLAQLAMHSTYETAGLKDIEEMIKGLSAFYNSHLVYDNKGSYKL